jgi:hypothetical protein
MFGNGDTPIHPSKKKQHPKVITFALFTDNIQHEFVLPTSICKARRGYFSLTQENRAHLQGPEWLVLFDSRECLHVFNLFAVN